MSFVSTDHLRYIRNTTILGSNGDGSIAFADLPKGVYKYYVHVQEEVDSFVSNLSAATPSVRSHKQYYLKVYPRPQSAASSWYSTARVAAFHERIDDPRDLNLVDIVTIEVEGIFTIEENGGTVRIPYTIANSETNITIVKIY